MSITSSSMLVELNISVWTANKLDKGATDSVTNNAHAVKNAAQVRKNLMAGTHQRKEIADHAAACRLWHNIKTLPWADKGPRLLPTSLFLDYKQEANTRRDAFHRMVDQFVQDYPALVQTSHNYLGDLFDAADYPSANEVHSKFGFRMVFAPVPESGDFRLDLPAQELDEVKRGYEDSFKDRLAEAMKDPWDRLHKTLLGISEKLTDVDNIDVKRRYHDSLIDNAVELCGVLTHLNITGDPELEQARRSLERVIASADIEVIRENPDSRADVKQQVDDILKQYRW
jgi:hypothetical protein